MMAAQKSGNEIETCKTSLLETVLNDDNYIKTLYYEYKNPFSNWAKFNFALSDEEIKDLYQDAIIGFYKNIVSGKLDRINYSTKTYLFSIGKNLILNRMRFNKRFESVEADFDSIPEMNVVDYSDVKEEAKLFIEKKISELGEPCRTILKLYYYYDYSLEAIQREVKSKNPNVVKAQKARCIKALRLLLTNKFKLENFFD